MLRALIALCLILTAFAAMAKPQQVKPDTDIVPERKPIAVEEPQVPCLKREPVSFLWLLRDEHGNLIAVTGRTVRLRC